MSKARQAADEVNRQQAGRRNLIINGAMQVWQRGTSFTGHINGAYTADRYSVQKTGTSNVTRESCSLDEFEYCLKQTQTASGGGKHKPMQLVETGNYFANGTTLTFSFWARANATRAYGVTAWDGTNVYSLGSVDITSSWQRFTKTFTLTARPSSFLRLHVDDTVSQNDWIETTGWQLEVGEVATPFEHRSYAEELALCSRYYHRYVSAGDNEGVMMAMRYNNGNAYGSYPYPVPMRTNAPTFSSSSTTAHGYLYGTGFANVTSFQCTQMSDRVAGINFGASGVSNGQAVQLRAGPSGTWFDFDAEL